MTQGAGTQNGLGFAENFDFSGINPPAQANGLVTNGQLWIGRTAVNGGGTHIDVNTLTAGAGITITNGPGTITIAAAGGAVAVDSFAMQTGTSPVVPDGTGLVTFNGSVVAAGTNPVRTDGTGANTMALEIQKSQAIAASDATKIGLSNFNSAQFQVDGNAFVSLVGSTTTPALISIDVDAHTAPGTDPVVPNASGILAMTGAQVATGTIGANVIRTDSLAANSLTIEIQRSTAVGATDSTKNGVSHFDSAAFDVDANGFVQLNGGGIAATSFDVQANTAPGTDPVVPTAAGVVTVNGAAVANHSVVLETRSRAANAYNVEVQYSTSAAATDATKSGVAHFDSAKFTVDGNGFVTLAGGGAGTTITGDSGGPISPSGGNWNLLGRAGSKVSGAGSTLTVKSPPYADQGGSTTVTLNSGSFATAAITLTLPASAGLIDGDLCEFVCTSASALIVQSVGAQKIRLGTLITGVAGTITSTQIGDAVVLRFRASDGFWYATSIVGTWLVSA